MKLETLDYEIEPKYDPRKELSQYYINNIEYLLSKHMQDIAGSEAEAKKDLIEIMTHPYEIDGKKHESGFDYFDRKNELSVADKETYPRLYKRQKELVINYLR
jgi:hypothetical protein